MITVIISIECWTHDNSNQQRVSEHPSRVSPSLLRTRMAAAFSASRNRHDLRKFRRLATECDGLMRVTANCIENNTPIRYRIFASRVAQLATIIDSARVYTNLSFCED
jgi:hypothetical protein